MRVEINGVEKRLGEKVDAVRDRVSRIEGQLAPTPSVIFNPTTFNPSMQKEAALAAHAS